MRYEINKDYLISLMDYAEDIKNPIIRNAYLKDIEGLHLSIEKTVKSIKDHVYDVISEIEDLEDYFFQHGTGEFRISDLDDLKVSLHTLVEG